VDGTTTLAIEYVERIYELQGQTTTAVLNGQVQRTIQSGQTLAIGGLMTGQDNELLVFITPTLLPADSDTGNESGQKRGMIQGIPTVPVAP
jgi:hypothetical protein